MTDRQKDIERLAEGVMGWHKSSPNGLTWLNTDGDVMRSVGFPFPWNPFESWHDAGMVWDELAKQGYHRKLACYHDGLCVAEIYKVKDIVFSGVEDIPPAAIAEAALRVLGTLDD